ncbi:MAG: hypothetical protein L6367_12095 [Cellulomonas sp.]|nr:hypothetical protein [Cellulomonas sp.]
MSVGPGSVVRLPDGTAVRLLGQLDVVPAGDGLRPVRVPAELWDRFPPERDAVASVVSQAAGVRFAVRTSATWLSLRARFTRVDIGDLAGPVNDLVTCIDGAEVARFAAPVHSVETLSVQGERTGVVGGDRSGTLRLGPLPGRDATVTVWLPQGMVVDLIGLSGDAPVEPAPPSERPVWVHHGSSISHCATPADPLSAWPVVAAGLAGVEVVNLGFAGSCMLDPFVAEAIAQVPADLISLKVGINLVGGRSMDRRTFVPALHGFLDTIRRVQPMTPIVLVSAISWPGGEDVPGPSDLELRPDGSLRFFACGDPADVAKGALTLATSREHVRHVAQVRAAGEPCTYLDGRELYGPADAVAHPLPDDLHPDAPVYREMGRRFARLVLGPDGLVPIGTPRPGTDHR